MIRVEARVSVTAERYDDDGNLVAQQPLQPLTLAGMTVEAFARAWAQAGIAVSEAVWPATAKAEE